MFKRKTGCVSCVIWVKWNVSPIFFCAIDYDDFPSSGLTKAWNILVCRWSKLKWLFHIMFNNPTCISKAWKRSTGGLFGKSSFWFLLRFCQLSMGFVCRQWWFDCESCFFIFGLSSVVWICEYIYSVLVLNCMNVCFFRPKAAGYTFMQIYNYNNCSPFSNYCVMNLMLCILAKWHK